MGLVTFSVQFGKLSSWDKAAKEELLQRLRQLVERNFTYLLTGVSREAVTVTVTEDFTTELRDVQDATASTTKIRVEQESRAAIAIHVDGYGLYAMEPGFGAVVMLEILAGELRVITWPDIRDEDCEIMEMGKAKEIYRVEEDEDNG